MQFRELEELMWNQGQIPVMKLGSTLTVGTCLTPKIILELEQAVLGLEVYSFVSNTEEIEQKLLKAELDAAVVEGEITSPDLIVIPIIDDMLVLTAGIPVSYTHLDVYKRQRRSLQDRRNRTDHRWSSNLWPGCYECSSDGNG